jgi:hypothetical protein
MARPGSKLGQAGTAEKKGRYLSAVPAKVPESDAQTQRTLEHSRKLIVPGAKT